MNAYNHTKTALLAFAQIEQVLNKPLYALAEKNQKCCMYWDMTTIAVKAKEPEDWPDIIPVNGDGIVGLLATGKMSPYDVIKTCVKKTLAAVAAGQQEKAVKILLAYSHYFCDLAEPVHAIDNSLIDKLYRRPELLQSANIHQLLENINADQSVTIKEPVYFKADMGDIPVLAMQSIMRLKKEAAYLLPGLIAAVYSGDSHKAAEIKGEAVRLAAESFAEFAAVILASADFVVENKLTGHEFGDMRLKHFFPETCILDACCNYHPTVDRTLVYCNPAKSEDKLVLGGRECGGIGIIPLTPYAAEHPDHPAIPFAHGNCIALLGYRINLDKRYSFKTIAGFNESVAEGGKIRLAVFSEEKLFFKTEAFGKNESPISIDVEVAGDLLYFYAEDVDQTFPPLKYVALAEPRLVVIGEVKKTIG